MPSAVVTLLWVLGILLAKHWLCDFVLQTKLQVVEKGVYGRPGGVLHGLTHIAGTAPVFLVAPVPLGVGAAVLVGEFVVHYHVDWAKEQILKRTGWGYQDAPYWSVFGFDQLLHGATYLAVAGALLHPW